MQKLLFLFICIHTRIYLIRYVHKVLRPISSSDNAIIPACMHVHTNDLLITRMYILLLFSREESKLVRLIIFSSVLLLVNIFVPHIPIDLSEQLGLEFLDKE